MKKIIFALSAVALLGSTLPAQAAKPGGSGASIRIEALGTPNGARSSRANAINAAGTVVVGDVYWEATFTSRNNWYAARWTRPTGSGAWLAEDLRPLLPPSRWSWASLVNDAGTVVVRSEDDRDGSQYRLLVVSSAGSTIDLGLHVVAAALGDDDTLAGFRYDPAGALPDEPLYWHSPYSIAETLPVLAAGYGAEATLFAGGEIRGTATDADGAWLVFWRGGPGQWVIERSLKLPAGFGFSPGGANAQGRLAGTHCANPCGWVKFNPPQLRAVAWDSPYAAPPTFLPNLAGTYSWAELVMESGVVVGSTVASNGVDMLPVMWPTPSTVKALPLLPRAKSGGTGGVNQTQITGDVAGNAVVWTLP